MDIGSRLRVAREASGLTQSAVSRATGIAVPNLSRIESGKADLRMSTLGRMLDALGLEVRLVPRTSRVSMGEVMGWSQLGRSRLVAAGVGPSSPQDRLDTKRSRGVDITVEQALLDTNA
ncbi:MAG: helix-turn-helix transcriptional regulator [Actinobacteria bacterium]|nr:helix-turn-helix transcriptional regulator [Actinomycetota bacterium]